MNFVLLLLGLVGVARGYRILVVFPLPSRSHYILGNGVGRGLANAGHDVTVIAPYEDKNAPKNYKNVVLTGVEDALWKGEAKEKFNPVENGKVHPWFTMLFVLNFMGNHMIEKVLGHPNFQKVLKEQFDVVIVEQFRNDAMKALGCHFNAPLIMVSSVGVHTWVVADTGSPIPPSYVPDMSLSYTSDMNLLERGFNLLTQLVYYLNSYLLFYPAQKAVAQKYFPKCANNELIISNVSLYFINSHESTNEPVPAAPNMVNIGGYHISPPKELPADLKTFLDNAKEGVVYFSMGSNIKFSELGPEVTQAIVRAFKKIKQKVLWKYDGDELPGKPGNVKIAKWFPQADILAHPNVKLFITHGGLLSTLETIYHGVPVLTLPVFGDQRLNAARTEIFGYGLAIDFFELNEENFSDAIEKMLSDPKYFNTAKKRSVLFHDRPMKPVDSLVYWTEYIARHRGAPHLKVAGFNLPWYKYFLVDVIVVFVLLPVLLLYLLVKKLCSKASKRGQKKNKSD
ncbi:unnamed protein product [Phyllotreta striolata]|uniref:UDP-glucuronosyltransferase n=1 Tax=Phyllotreta striolata TaxID=444603 RepID=A0A9N9XJS0_PHYSR|nr:unnamed protein product [Phyllotreta striolata]